MFTGLIEEIGEVVRLRKGNQSAQLFIKARKVLDGLKIGDSISTNGVCLTVINYTSQTFTVDVMPETMRKSNLNQLKIGSYVNLERAMAVGDRFGGHMVSGHIDGVGVIHTKRKEGNATWIRVRVKEDLIKYMVEKGSVAIDGTSLTLAKVDKNSISVSIIPLTQMETTLVKKDSGDLVNLECDIVGKYVEKISGANAPIQTITLDFLKENGFAE